MTDWYNWTNLVDFLVEIGGILVVTGVIVFWALRMNRYDPRRGPRGPARDRHPEPGPLPPAPRPQPEPPSPFPPPPGPEPPSPPLPGGPV